jgi:hypothetical protein
MIWHNTKDGLSTEQGYIIRDVLQNGINTKLFVPNEKVDIHVFTGPISSHVSQKRLRYLQLIAEGHRLSSAIIASWADSGIVDAQAIAAARDFMDLYPKE